MAAFGSFSLVIALALAGYNPLAGALALRLIATGQWAGISAERLAGVTHGFDPVAWVAPCAVFAAAMLGTILLVRRWTSSEERSAPAASPANETLRRQIRRETSGDGGY